MQKSQIPLRIIKILSDGIFHSTEQLGETIGIRSTEINQYIQTVKNFGLDVFSLSNRGYCLTYPLQLLDKKKIYNYIPSILEHIEVLSIIDSTNQYLLERMHNLRSGDTCVAEYQYSGRGRLNRKWVSTFGSNIYFSMFWRLVQDPESIMGLSLVIGTSITKVLRKMGVKDVRVKWPNDIYLNGKKLAGILVELKGRIGKEVQLVIGIGINIFIPITMQKASINQDWTTLQEAGITIDRNQLTAELFSTLKLDIIKFEKEGLTAFIDIWRKLDNYCDCLVKLIIGEKEIRGISRGIDSEGALLLEQNGTIKAYSSGEISLRDI